MQQFITKSEQQTIKLGKKIAQKFCGGEVIALIGELGSGKTVLIKGLAQGLGIKKTITSPTFVLMKIYKIPNSVRQSVNQTLNFCHVDAYRLKSGQDLIDIGIKDWLGKSNTITAIEWAGRVKNILPKNTITIKLKLGKKKNTRHISIRY